jgi:hypothetical protein
MIPTRGGPPRVGSSVLGLATLVLRPAVVVGVRARINDVVQTLHEGQSLNQNGYGANRVPQSLSEGRTTAAEMCFNCLYAGR